MLLRDAKKEKNLAGIQEFQRWRVRCDLNPGFCDTRWYEQAARECKDAPALSFYSVGAADRDVRSAACAFTEGLSFQEEITMNSMSFFIILVLMTPGLAVAQQTASRPAITGISHLTVYSDNMAKSKQFYASLLGWDPVPATGAGAGIRFYVNHSQYVELATPPSPGQAWRLDHVGFSTSDAEALRRFLGAHGVAVPDAVTMEKNGDRSFLVHDPEGNKVAFVQQGDHPPTKPESAAQRLSTHIIHAGYMVRNRAALDRFYKDVLGFHLYWQGGAGAGQTDWVMMQVPDGTDWIEYMLNLPDAPDKWALGSANHMAPGVESVAALQARLEQRGWKPAAGKNPQILGVDGKMQLDLNDPDGTRIEFMEFKPVKEPCCSAYTGPQPSASDAW
jgi:catechol 2,3-dioxygenase-like lactoylglutathione lyase family enzyme